MLARNNGRRD
uniref:Uncharacterized protein n=1 Tax=Rhizophora mucronata TaxID=61149 RepID=A0A2P2LAL0_RHIMU